MKLNTLNQFLNLLPTSPDVEFNNIQTDSRKVEPGDLYVAIVGEHHDGHDFVKNAKDNGAVGAIVSQSVDVDMPTLQVEDTIKALAQCAKKWRAQFDMPIIGVTGSCGKTTVKEMIASIFHQAFGENYLATKGNLNTDITVPIMLLGLQKNQRAAVIEMGMTQPGDLVLLSDLVKPHVAAITNITMAHSEFLGGLEDIAKFKADIFSGLQSDGIAVLNADEPFVPMWHEIVGDKKTLTFGKKGEIKISNIQATFKGCEFDLQFPEKLIHVKTQLPGEHIAMNAACVAACAYAIDISVANIQAGLENVQRPARRMQQLQGKNGSVLIDDGYNANLKTTKAAVDVLTLFPGKKILVLGAMRELGPTECDQHAELGEYAKTQGIDCLFAVGDIAEHAATAFGEQGVYFEDREALAKQVLSLLDDNTCVLVKGSLSMDMKEFVDRFSY